MAGLAYQQVIKGDIHHERERMQSQRRILVPGPRGDIVDREGRVLVGNQQRLSIVLYLDELQAELRRAYIQIRKNYRDSGDKDLPNSDEMAQIARVSVAQRYLDQVNALIGRDEKINQRDFDSNHYSDQLLLPYVLINDLEPEEFARLVEHLPVNSPLQVYTSSKRSYPYDSAAAHVLGMVKPDPSVDVDDLGGKDLKTSRMKGTVGRNGLERQFDAVLQGEAGGAIFQVDRMGYKVKPLEQRTPRQGKRLATSLDIDLQQVAEKKFAEVTGDKSGAVVALDVNTGEVLVLASMPNYDLNETSPRISTEKYAEIESQSGWLNRAVYGLYPPGSTFKLVTSIAGLRSGTITPESVYVTDGTYTVGNRTFRDHAGCITGPIDFRLAIQQSVNTFFCNFGVLTGPNAIAAEAQRFHLNEPMGLELPETHQMYVGNDEWKRKHVGEAWRDGDTANLSIGQGYIQVTPLQMACFTASFARGETYTQPFLLHQPDRPTQHTEAIGLTAAQSGAMLEAMENVVIKGTASLVNAPALGLRIPGLRIAGKTGTAQKDATIDGRSGKIEIAWYVCFAPADHPEIAIAVVVEGDTPDESYAGGRYAAPIGQAVLKEWWTKKTNPTGLRMSLGH
jgi:penicillin-binding protein 2